MTVLIAGAGIAGLTAALSLHAAGIECVVVDKVRDITPAGVGINLQPHAVRELSELGLGEQLDAMGVRTVDIVHYDRFGNRIWGVPRGVKAGYRWPQYSVHRGELQMLLLHAVRERLGPGAVRPGVALDGFDETADGVEVRLHDRRQETETTVTAEALIGADGLYSAVRSRLHPDEGAPLSAGIRMWRGVTRREPFLSGESVIAAGCNAAAKFVAYPISPTVNGRTLLNWVAEVKLPDDGRVADWNARGKLADVLPHFHDWTFDWLDVPGMLRDTEQILEYPMVDRDPLPRWGTDRVMLIGDAAHPMYPIGSNGGSQAVVDARVLAYRLATAGDVATAMAQFQRDRVEPTNAIVLSNRDMPADRVLRTVAERAPSGFGEITEVLSVQELDTIDAAYTKTTSLDVEELNNRPSWDVAG